MKSVTTPERVKFALLAGAMMLPLSADEAAAQRQEDSLAIEEIIVTAEKRENTLQNTPLSIAAIGGETMERMGIKSSLDLASYVSNAAVGNFRNNIIVNVRGIQSNNANEVGDPAVAMHIDGIYISRPRGARALFFDAERVEVLRGPQGTLYGRNATAGSINVISNKPVNEWQGSAELTLGSFNQIATRGMINIPLVDDKLMMRAAIMTDNHDGYNINNRRNPTIRNTDDADELAARLHLLFKPTERLSILFSGRYQDMGGVGGHERAVSIVEDPSNPRVFSLDTQPVLDAEVKSLSAQVDLDLDVASLTYLVGWNKDDFYNVQDLDQTVPIFGNARSDAVFGPSIQHTETVSHELRLTSNATDSRLSWIVGLYHFKEDQTAQLFIKTSPIQTIYANQFDVSARSKAAFGQLAFRFTDQLEAVGGLRYTEDKKARFGETRILINGFPVSVSPNIGSLKESRTNWKAGLNWRPHAGSLHYAQVATGYKAGGFNNGVLNSYQPEDLTSYEVGTKQTLFDGRLQFNASAFYMTYKNLQVTVIDIINGVPGTLTRNAAKATSWGVELEGQARLTRQARINFGVGYLNAKYDKYVTDDPLLPGLTPEDLSGNHLIQAPKWSANVGLEYEFALGNIGTLTPSAHVSFKDDVYLREFNKPIDFQKRYTKTDIVLTYRTNNGRFHLEGFVNNLENKSIRNNLSNSPGHGAFFSMSPPRTWGVRGGVRF